MDTRDAVLLRLPPELKASLAESARINRRSLNAEVQVRLERSVLPAPTAFPAEAQR
jgi:hypothetical protein